MKERGTVRICVCACVQVCVCLSVCAVHVRMCKCGHARKHLQILSDLKSVHMFCVCISKFPVYLVLLHTWEWRVMPLPRSWLKLFSPITLRAVIAKASIESESEGSYRFWESLLKFTRRLPIRRTFYSGSILRLHWTYQNYSHAIRINSI